MGHLTSAALCVTVGPNNVAGVETKHPWGWITFHDPSHCFSRCRNGCGWKMLKMVPHCQWIILIFLIQWTFLDISYFSNPKDQSFFWLVVWNIFYFSIYWEFHHPIWRTHIFQRGRYTTNQNIFWVDGYPKFEPCQVAVINWTSEFDCKNNQKDLWAMRRGWTWKRTWSYTSRYMSIKL